VVVVIPEIQHATIAVQQQLLIWEQAADVELVGLEKDVAEDR